MRDHPFNPRKLDVEALAAQAASFDGDWPAHSLSRLADAAAPEVPAADWPMIHWTLTGEKREPRRGVIETWLHLLQIGAPLPTLPLWLADNFALPLNLEESYEQACRDLRIE